MDVAQEIYRQVLSSNQTRNGGVNSVCTDKQTDWEVVAYIDFGLRSHFLPQTTRASGVTA